MSLYAELTSLGSFYPLDVFFNHGKLQSELSGLSDQWRPYNKSKPQFKREGLSLFSLDGATSGEIDLNSIREYNLANQTQYNEMSFRTPTANWAHLKSISEPLCDFERMLGRSHLIRFQEGGFFPPHRDLGQSFRLIAFFDCTPHTMFFTLDDRRVRFMPNQLYFADTRLTHSLFSFTLPTSSILVLNLEISPESIALVYRHLMDK